MMDNDRIVQGVDPARAAMQQAVKRNRKWRREAGQKGSQGIYTVRPAPTPEHFHIIYHVPNESLAIPHYGELFMSEHDVYARMKEMGAASEPNTEYYDSGEIMIETTMHGRTGLFRVILEAARCIRRSCRPNLPRDIKKRSLILLPGADSETVEVKRIALRDL